jgi:hypothetical protein
MHAVSRSRKPRVAFCGFLSHPQRATAVKAVQNNQEIESEFLVRDRFWGGTPHDPDLIAAHEANMQSCEFSLCLRGAGNFSMRLYHVLAAGRIPVLIRDKTTLLPFEDQLDWESFTVMAPRPEDLPKAILQFHQRHNILKTQQRCAEVYRTWFELSQYPQAFLQSLKAG